ncbi:hypothetical protein DRF67_06620 [Chryseobacterium pennipullorum]|uniref:Uncharacterized protein n=1 Tax=Chryseobacterium pennipullorum TaxID=2258963 RepID=A0A3D9B574_9FLAO|nr:hypothetical protein DRF67_06620 [Chryseobacterium pennipullorum]
MIAVTTCGVVIIYRQRFDLVKRKEISYFEVNYLSLNCGTFFYKIVLINHFNGTLLVISMAFRCFIKMYFFIKNLHVKIVERLFLFKTFPEI